MSDISWNCALGILFTFFALTGILVFVSDNTADNSTSAWAVLKKNDNVVFAWHLACWMVAGMIANYYWGAFTQTKPTEQVTVNLGKALLPLLVAPIVFYPTWNLWGASNKKDRIMFVVLAFQNGFFWQAFFDKAAQSVK